VSLAESMSSGRIVLRPHRLEDVDDVTAGCADPLTQRFRPHLPHPYTRTAAEWWVREGSLETRATGGANYAIADSATDRLLGGIGLTATRGGRGEIGYWVAPWARRAGVATAATRLLTAHAFAEGFARLTLRMEFENVASQRVALATGYTREGVERAAGARRDGTRFDLLLFARVIGDAEGPTARLLPDLPGGQLSDDVVVLRPLTAADADDTYGMRSLDDVVASSVPPRRPDRAKVAQQCARSASDWLAGQRADFTIRDRRTGTYAGEIGFYYWEPSTQQAMIGYSIRPEWRGMGYAKRAARLVSQWGFEAVGVARVVAGTAPGNIGSQRVLERAGFIREGYQRARLPGPDGTRIDDLLYARLNPQLGGLL
jgi:RimJ/RimL family protein N-acetyltransferase